MENTAYKKNIRIKGHHKVNEILLVTKKNPKTNNNQVQHMYRYLFIPLS